MKRAGLLLAGLTAVCLASAETLFEQDFSKVEAGPMPDEFLVLDGQFSVQEEAGNRYAELPGAPLESYGFLFGRNEPHGVAVSARIFGTRAGRKFPTFGLGLNGASGYRLQVAPAKGMVELLRGETIVASAPFAWKSGGWTLLRLSLRQVKENEFRIEGSAWDAGAEAPTEPLVKFTEEKAPPPGKASAWGMPFAGTPIRFDDLKVTRLGGA